MVLNVDVDEAAVDSRTPQKLCWSLCPAWAAGARALRRRCGCVCGAIRPAGRLAADYATLCRQAPRRGEAAAANDRSSDRYKVECCSQRRFLLNGPRAEPNLTNPFFDQDNFALCIAHDTVHALSPVLPTCVTHYNLIVLNLR